MRAPRKGDLVVVSWDDITGTAGWDAEAPECESIESVGWVSSISRKHILLVRCKSDDVAGAHLCIPRGCVTKISVIHE